MGQCLKQHTGSFDFQLASNMAPCFGQVSSTVAGSSLAPEMRPNDADAPRVPTSFLAQQQALHQISPVATRDKDA